jgi:F0F1-type ATP synthase alpha subunit
LASQIAILLMTTEGYLDDIPIENVSAFEAELLARFKAEHPGLYEQVNRSGEISAEMRERLVETMSKQSGSQGLP